MQFRAFERELLRLAFTTRLELSPASLAFVLGISVKEAEEHMHAMVSQGVLELHSDDEGHLRYAMPDRPAEPLAADHPALIGPGPLFGARGAPAGAAPPQAIALQNGQPPSPPRELTQGQAAVSMFLNALVCPGLGSLTGGKTAVGAAQLSMFLIGLPLAVIAVGLPIMLAAWTWGIFTGAQLMAEAKD